MVFLWITLYITGYDRV